MSAVDTAPWFFWIAQRSRAYCDRPSPRQSLRVVAQVCFCRRINKRRWRDVITESFVKLPIGELVDGRVGGRKPSIGFFQGSSDCRHIIFGLLKSLGGVNNCDFRMSWESRRMLLQMAGFDGKKRTRIDIMLTCVAGTLRRIYFSAWLFICAISYVWNDIIIKAPKNIARYAAFRFRH